MRIWCCSIRRACAIRADYHDPVRAAEGIDAVWVNGELAYDGSAVTAARSGRFLAPAS